MLPDPSIDEQAQRKADNKLAQDLNRVAEVMLQMLIAQSKEAGLKPPEVAFLLSCMVAKFNKVMAKGGTTRAQIIDVLDHHLRIEGIE